MDAGQLGLGVPRPRGVDEERGGEGRESPLKEGHARQLSAADQRRVGADYSLKTLARGE